MNTLTVYKAKWIDFMDVSSQAKKTKTFLVINRESKTQIGEVKWYGAWRQYSFFPNPKTVYERQCLLDIAKFINQLMVERKIKKQLLKSEM